MLDQAPVTPFLKWAGGKRWLVRDHFDFFELAETSRYIEPFIGSAAVFFAVAPKVALLNDANTELIETYRTIRTSSKEVAEKLRRHHGAHSEEYFYSVRASRPTSPSGRAARFIYLNRTCFNGLYRVNRKGEFNVPIGTKTDVILSTDDFEAVARVLRGAELSAGDFEVVIDKAGSGDFVFADPPYTVKHNMNGFIKYNERLFSWEDQERLKEALSRAANRGASILLTNADHSSIRQLYKGCKIRTLERTSVMASESWRRRTTTEVLISF